MPGTTVHTMRVSFMLVIEQRTPFIVTDVSCESVPKFDPVIETSPPLVELEETDVMVGPIQKNI